MATLRERTIRGFGWRLGVDVGQQVLLIAFTALLARLLTRADFGLVAMALTVMRFVHTVTEVGFGMSIIQDQRIRPGQVSAVFLIKFGLDCLVAIACFFGAGTAAEFFNEPRLEGVVAVMCWSIPISGLSFPSVLMRKELRFGPLSLIEIGTVVVSNIIGVVMAFMGYGVWALVYRLIAQRAIFALAVWPASGFRPVKPDFEGIASHFSYGINMMGSNIFNYFSQNMVAIITGKFIGAETLGSYTIAYNLAIVPAQRMQSVLITVLTPAFARIKEGADNLRAKVRFSLFSMALLFVPAMFGLSAVAESVVLTIYGAKWGQAGLFLSFLAVVGLLKGIEHLMRSVILAKGFANRVFHSTVVESLVGLPLYWIGVSQFGVMGLVWAYLTASAASFLMNVRYLHKSIDERDLFLKATSRTFIASAFMFVGVSMVQRVLTAPPPIALAAGVAAGVLIYVPVRYILLTLNERTMIHELPLIRRITWVSGA